MKKKPNVAKLFMFSEPNALRIVQFRLLQLRLSRGGRAASSLKAKRSLFTCKTTGALCDFSTRTILPEPLSRRLLRLHVQNAVGVRGAAKRNHHNRGNRH
mmetsp:Transcript_248/g.971  ORF Transcript_248/g.971 Transcript_248/m.971 type:complete len:100 (-) Transcript_248:424-723(-)